MTDLIPITPEGYERIREELKKLKTIERPTVIQEIADARALGDLSENAEYHAAREKQGFIEARIADLDSKITRIKIIEHTQKGPVDTVIFGAFVKVCDVTDGAHGTEQRYRIVGDLEADVKNNCISLSSPIARALINKQVGDVVTVSLPRGEKEYEILGVSLE
jgi:transcription elongation factor GreA